MSSRKKPRRSTEDEDPLLDGLFGRRAARRIRIATAIFAVSSFGGACLVFALWSQTIGKLLFLPGAAIAFLWFLVKTAEPDDPFAGPRRYRRALVAVALLTIALGWAAYFTVDGDLGLLLVVIGSLPLLLSLVGMRSDPVLDAAGPIDGPWYGDTSGGP